MHIKLDFIVALAFIAVQWRVTVACLGAAARSCRGRMLALARAAVVALNLALLTCYALSLSEVVSHYHLNPRYSLYAGAAALGYLIAATAVLVLQLAVRAARRWVVHPEMDPTRRAVLDAASVALVGSPIFAMGYGALVQRTNFQVREVEVALAGLPAGLDGLRLLQLSDIHLSAFLSEAEFARVVDASNELRPNLAVVTGDLISARGDPLDACIRQIARLRSDAGTFACMGNHERYAGCEEYATQAAAKLGVRFLRQRHQQLRFGNASINLAGVDYQSLQDRNHYLQGVERLLAPGQLNVLLSHNPDLMEAAARQGWNLLLAGHTHGGQVTVEILDQSINPARFITPFVYGLYRHGRSAGYVTRGIGTIGIPARIGATPEITLLRLRKA